MNRHRRSDEGHTVAVTQAVAPPKAVHRLQKTISCCYGRIV